MQPASTVCILCCCMLLVSLFDSIFAVPVWNSKKQHGNERRKRRSTYNDGDGDLRPGDQWPQLVPVCSEDEYYDVNVQACSQCSDVCRPNIDLTFCASKCREYFRTRFDSPAQRFGSPTHLELHSSFVVTAISSTDAATEERLTNKPLFWTSVASMTIAVAATAAIIVLCIRRRKPGRSFVGRMVANEDCRARTLSELSDDREPDHRTLLDNMNGGSPRNTSCRDEERIFDGSDNRTTGHMTGGRLATDRFGTGGGCIQNDHSCPPAMPSPDRDRHPTPEKMSQIHIHKEPIRDRISTNVYQNSDIASNWIRKEHNWKESSPSMSISEFADGKRQLLPPDSEPLSSSSLLSTSLTALLEGTTSYASSLHEASQSTETKRFSYFQENDETNVKENRLIDLHDPRLPSHNDFSPEPKAMGILMSNGNSIDDITQLQVTVRMMRNNDTKQGQCPQAKGTFYNSASDCDDGIATGECTYDLG